MEEVWDRLLSTGKIVYGMATDDAHVFKQPGNPLRVRPGPRLGDGARGAPRAAAR